MFNFVFTFIFTIPGLFYYAGLGLVGFIIKDEKLVKYARGAMIAPDQWWNAALMGEEDETVSSRLGRSTVSGRAKWGAKMMAKFVNFLFLILRGQKNHCIESIEKRYLEGAPSDETWSFIKGE